MDSSSQQDQAERIGLLCLDETLPNLWPRGSLADPDLLPAPTSAAIVPSATLNTLLERPQALANAYVEAAKDLVHDGATLVTSNCGYTVAFQQELATRCRVPVVTSSLLLLPFILASLPRQSKVAILCFDSEKLLPDHLRCAGAEGLKDRIKLVGLQGTASWRAITGPAGHYDWHLIGNDLQNLVSGLSAGPYPVGAILIECCAFLPFQGAIEDLVGCPVYGLPQAIELALPDACKPRRPENAARSFDELQMLERPNIPRRC